MMDKDRIVQLIPAAGWWNSYRLDDGAIYWSACPAFGLTEAGEMAAMDFSDGFGERADSAKNYVDTCFFTEPPPREEPAEEAEQKQPA